jgi:hypothetical protein
VGGSREKGTVSVRSLTDLIGHHLLRNPLPCVSPTLSLWKCISFVFNLFLAFYYCSAFACYSFVHNPLLLPLATTESMVRTLHACYPAGLFTHSLSCQKKGKSIHRRVKVSVRKELAKGKTGESSKAMRRFRKQVGKGIVMFEVNGKLRCHEGSKRCRWKVCERRGL